MEQHPPRTAPPRATPPPEPRTAAECASRDLRRQLGLDERAWSSILMAVREPSWDSRGERRS